MTVETSEMLRRLSGALKGEIGPGVENEYVRTQAFMASVILERLSKQVALAPAHTAAEEAEVAALHERLRSVLADGPAPVSSVAATAAQAGTVDALGPLVKALYSWGIDQPGAAEALGAIRAVLRADIDRRMEIAR